MTLRGVPVLQYDGRGASLPADVDDRLASHSVTPGRQLGSIPYLDGELSPRGA
jgi:hypothetical protein